MANLNTLIIFAEVVEANSFPGRRVSFTEKCTEQD